MRQKAKKTRIESHFWCGLFLLSFLVVGCAQTPEEAVATIALQPSTTPTLTTTPTHTPNLTISTQEPPAAPPATSTTTPRTLLPTSTPFPFPLPTFSPFPTVTPNYVQYDTKPIFLIYYTGAGGDGASYSLPALMIYGDGQILKRDRWGSYLEGQLTVSAMCDLRQQIIDTGFTMPHDIYFTERGGSLGASHAVVQFENINYHFYNPDVPYLLDDLAAGLEIIQNYEPPITWTSFAPEDVMVHFSEIEDLGYGDETTWPASVPAISELWLDRSVGRVRFQGDLAVELLQVTSENSPVFVEGDDFYWIEGFAILPHETLYRYLNYYGFPPYNPVISCEEEEVFLDSTLPTVTPTFSPVLSPLSGLGKLVTIGRGGMHVMEADGTNRIQITNNLARESDPIWSPDGEYIAFVSEADGDSEIYVMRADGTDVRQLTHNNNDDYDPAWSPDGTQLVFIRWESGGSELYVMNNDGSLERPLTSDNHLKEFPIWLPSGDAIIYTRTAGQSALVHLTFDSLEQRLLGSVGQYPPRPDVSPDGRYLVTSELYNVMILDLETKKWVREIEIPYRFVENFNWSGFGDFIFFTALTPDPDYDAGIDADVDNREIFALNLMTEELIQVTYTLGDEYELSLWP